MRPGGPDSPSGAELVGFGVFLAAVVVVPLVIGAIVDGALHTGPWFLFLGLLLGIVAAVVGTYTRFREYL